MQESKHILAQELKSTQENHLHYRCALFCPNVLTLSLNIKLGVQCLFFKLMQFLGAKSDMASQIS